jgi:hypothetical protein
VIVDEEGGVEMRRDRVEGHRGLGESEAIGEIIGPAVGVA